MLFVLVLEESLLLLAPFMPGNSLIFVAGRLTGTGDLEMWVLVPLFSAALIVGDGINYALGRLFGETLVRRERFVDRDRLARASALLDRYGGVVIALSRFMPLFRAIVPFTAGFLGMRQSTFWLFNIVSAPLAVLVICGGGYLVGTIPWVRENTVLTIAAVFAGLLVVSATGALVRHFRSAARPGE